MLENMITARKRRFDLIRTSLPGQLECWFKDYMNFRGYKASLDVRDDDGTIMIKVDKINYIKIIFNGKVVTHKAMDGLLGSEAVERDLRIQRKVLQDLKGYFYFTIFKFYF
jgi:hypothetical protein